MTDKEIKLKCLELATEAKVSNTLGLAFQYYNWIVELNVKPVYYDNKGTLSEDEINARFK